MDKKYHQEAVLKFHRTKKGLISKIYYSQCHRRKRKGNSLPKYTLLELKDWAFSQKEFHILFDNWKKSKYLKDLIPSFDRILSTKGYSLNNIQILTWKENDEKGKQEKSTGRNKSEIIQSINLITNEKLEFNTYREASKSTGENISTISLCINNNRNSRKFNWELITKT